MNEISSAAAETGYGGTSEVNTNRPETCYLLVDGLAGPIETVVPKSFAIRKFFVYADRPFNIGSDGLADTSGTINMSHVSVVLDTPSVLPTLQQDCFSGTVFKTVTIHMFANILENNKPVLDITLTNARIALVTANYKPAEDGGTSSYDLFGATTNYERNKELILDSAQKFPMKNAINDVVVKWAYDTIKVVVHKYEDDGQAAGQAATTVDLHKNMVTSS